MQQAELEPINSNEVRLKLPGSAIWFPSPLNGNVAKTLEYCGNLSASSPLTLIPSRR